MDREKVDDSPLLKVAETISDGLPVDWESEIVGDERLRRQMGRLRLLEAIAAVHRTPDAPGEEAMGVGRAGAKNSANGPSTAGHAQEGVLEKWGPLEILEKIDEGNFGEVYRAFDPTLQRTVALKLRRLDRNGFGHEPGQFIAEARRLARVRHDNVLVVHGADLHQGRVGLWTDLLDGQTLEKRLEEQGTISAQEATLIGIDLCRALAAVHGAGLVHRDVKTSNVMREKGGRIVLMDFGSGSPAGGSEAQGRPHARTGTPMAMAPEVLLHGEAPRPTVDIYGLGVLLYRLVTGRYPVEAATVAELMEKHRAGRMTPLNDARPNLPSAFVQVVERALAADPRNRYASAGQMEQALAAISGQNIQQVPPRPGLRMVLAAATFIAVAGVLISMWLLLSSGSFTVEGALFRTTESGAEERLHAGSSVRPGDRLTMEIRGSVPLHVYVLDEDAAGETFVLFPAGIDLQNPLPPGATHRLPGTRAGVQQHWIVTSAGGRETLLVIASKRPLPDIEREIAGLPRVTPGRPMEWTKIPEQSMDDVLRGIGGLEGPPHTDDAGMAGRLAAIEEGLDEGPAVGVWVRRIQLENPGP